jgi:site-specific DNA recombinase
MMMSDVISQERTGRVAAIYARVSSERQRQDETIQSQTVGLRELAAERGLLIVEDLVFEDEGFSGATLTRPALERLRDRAGEGAFEVLLCHAPDRLARRYAYQVLLLEELARAGVEVCFAKEPERGGTPEDELLRQFQGMIAEYERAQIRERTRRGKLHRARGGSQAVMSGAPYGYRYVKKTDHSEGFWEIDAVQAEVVRGVFARYVEDGTSIGEIARWLSERRVPTRTGKTVWDRSTVWAMLRNHAYRGQAAFGKTRTAERHGVPTRTTRARGERHGRRPTRQDQPAETWTLIAVPALIGDETFELAQARLEENKRFAKRNTKELTLLQGVLVCRECGYSCYRTCTRTTNKRISYYRCIGQDGWRHVGGRVCGSHPVRADGLDSLVWSEVRRLLEDPALVRAEIDRRLAALRTEYPATKRRDALERDLARADAAIGRLIEAYQEQLISLEELRARMPRLRKRQSTLRAQLDALDAELHDAETYLQLADTLEGFLGRLTDGLDRLDIAGQQRILRLVVREVLIGGDDDKITIRHSIPTPTGPDDPGYLLRGSSHLARVGEHLLALRARSVAGPGVSGRPIRALRRRCDPALRQRAAGACRPRRDRRAVGGGRSGTESGQGAHRVLQGLEPHRLSRARAVHVLGLHVSSPAGPGQGWRTLRQLRPGGQRRRRQGDPPDDQALAAAPTQRDDPRRPRTIDQRDRARMDQLLRSLLPLRVDPVSRAHQRIPDALGHAEVQTAARTPHPGVEAAGRHRGAPAQPLRPLGPSGSAAIGRMMGAR